MPEAVAETARALRGGAEEGLPRCEVTDRDGLLQTRGTAAISASSFKRNEDSAHVIPPVIIEARVTWATSLIQR